MGGLIVIVLFLYWLHWITKDHRVTEEEILKVKTPYDVAKLQKQIDKRGVKPFSMKKYIDFTITSKCDYCVLRRTEGLWRYNKTCFICGYSSPRGTGTVVQKLRIGEDGKIFDVLNTNQELDFKPLLS